MKLLCYQWRPRVINRPLRLFFFQTDGLAFPRDSVGVNNAEEANNNNASVALIRQSGVQSRGWRFSWRRWSRAAQVPPTPRLRVRRVFMMWCCCLSCFSDGATITSSSSSINHWINVSPFVFMHIWSYDMIDSMNVSCCWISAVLWEQIRFELNYFANSCFWTN